jgi:hypothetical protein
MPRHLSSLLPIAAAAALVWLPAVGSAAQTQPTVQPTAQPAAQPATHARRHVVRRSRGYGFLPGYRPPDVIEREDAWNAWRRGPVYWYGWPGWYRGRWNGGGFGPCWTQTPIGPIWNCGK